MPVEKENPSFFPWIVWSHHKEAMDFIKENVPENAVILMDGGGSGCFGANPSAGERIFPLTSRKVFYFTNYCWAKYDREEYAKRVDLYRRIAIDPDDSETLQKLKEYGVSHVFIGPNDVGLKLRLFQESSKYRLMYDENDYKIFEIK